jgi:hypothetical protein
VSLPLLVSLRLLLIEGRRTILNTGRSHQIGSSGHIALQLSFTRYTTSVLFRQCLDNLILVSLIRQPPGPLLDSHKTLKVGSTYLLSGKSFLLCKLLLQSHLLLGRCGSLPRNDRLLGFLGIRHVPVVLEISSRAIESEGRSWTHLLGILLVFVLPS